MANPQPSGNGEKRGLEDAGRPAPFLGLRPGRAVQHNAARPKGDTAEGCAVGDTNPRGDF